LSYTQFAYSDLRVDSEAARLTVANTGGRAGADVVQAYIARVSPGVYRPARQLGGFARVELAAGASAEVVVPLGQAAFRHFDVETGAWQVEAGLYEVQIGASAEDIRLTARLALDGTVPARPPDPDLPSYTSGQVAAVSRQEFERLLGRPLGPAPRLRPRRQPQVAELTHSHVIGDLAAAPSRLARFAHRAMRRRLAGAQGEDGPGGVLLFVFDLPIGRLAKLTGGAIDHHVVDGLLHIVNGRFWRGAAASLRAYVANRRANRATTRRLAQTQSGRTASSN
jgi:beta-glucosidase